MILSFAYTFTQQANRTRSSCKKVYLDSKKIAVRDSSNASTIMYTRIINFDLGIIRSHILQINITAQ